MKNKKIKNNEIHVYFCNFKEIPYEKQTLLKDILSEDEIKKYKELKLNTVKKQYLSSKGLTRYILQDYLNINGKNICFKIEDKGKPFIQGSNLKFNVSHSKDIYVIALALNTDIGIDIEAVKEIKNYKELSKRFFSEVEYNELNKIINKSNKDNMDMFYKIWTRKEAYVKSTGNGLLVDFKNFYTKPLEKYKYTIIQNNKMLLNIIGEDIPINKNYKLSCCYISRCKKNIRLNTLLI